MIESDTIDVEFVSDDEEIVERPLENAELPPLVLFGHYGGKGHHGAGKKEHLF